MLEPQPSILTYEQLDEAQQKAAREHSRGVDFNDRNSIRFYGYNEEKAMSSFLDELLEGIKSKDADLAGELLVFLNRNIDDLKLQKFQDILEGRESGGFFGMFSSKARELVKMIQFLVDRQRDVRTQFDKMQMQAETERNTLIQDNTKYQLLLDRTIDQIAAVMPIIVGGQLALQRGLEEFNALRTQAEEQPGNTLLASQVQDFSNNLEAFNHRLVNLQISFTKRAATTIPKIRAILEAKKSEGDYITKIALLVSMKDTLVQICEDGKKIVEDNRQKRVEAIENLKTVKSEMETTLRESDS